MRALAVAAALCVATLVRGAAQSTVCGRTYPITPHVAPNSFGPFRLGESEASLRQRCPDLRDSTIAGVPVLVGSVARARVALHLDRAGPDIRRVIGIQVWGDTAVHGPDSLGVGSSAADVDRLWHIVTAGTCDGVAQVAYVRRQPTLEVLLQDALDCAGFQGSASSVNPKQLVHGFVIAEPVD